MAADNATSPKQGVRSEVRWISTGFEELVQSVNTASENRRQGELGAPDFDVVIVGSGYGGSIAAAALAGLVERVPEADGQVHPRKIRVCVLERGNEYLSGMFPPRMADLAGHVRFSGDAAASARGERDGLFDVRIGPDVCALVGNGLGGGSLINAGVMAEPDDAVLASDAWPAAIRNDTHAFKARMQAVKRLLGAADARGDNTILRLVPGGTAKYRALQQLTEPTTPTRSFTAAPISVAMEAKLNSAGVRLDACKLCGDCASGCNHNAKDSLDLNLLRRAQAGGVSLFTGATVLRLERTPDKEAWLLHVVHTDDKLRRRQGPPLQLMSRNVILAAGTFGSTEILLRSGTDALQFSRRLGQRFSCNGDMIAVVYDHAMTANAVASEDVQPHEREVGPTITSIVRLSPAGSAPLVLEELAIPGPLRRLFEEVVTTAKVLHALNDPDRAEHAPSGETADPCAIDPRALHRSSVLAAFGDDGAAGALELIGGNDEADGDGAVRVRWRGIHDHDLFARQIGALEQRVRDSGNGGRVLPNPLWRLLPADIQYLVDDKHGPAFTVHPLGGCALGSGENRGVVDEFGRVFDVDRDRRADGLHRGLVVLDGSIVPTALGINPSLTIATLAHRAMEQLCIDWQYGPQVAAEIAHSGIAGSSTPLPASRLDQPDELQATTSHPTPGDRRPVFREIRYGPGKATQIELKERLSGDADLIAADGKRVRCVVELTLEFCPVDLLSLVQPTAADPCLVNRMLKLHDGSVRIYDGPKWHAWHDDGEPAETPAGLLLAEAQLDGCMHLLRRQKTTACGRTFRGLRAYVLNRGLRDTYQWLEGLWTQPKAAPRSSARRSAAAPGTTWQDAQKRWENALALASHAGEVRTLDYELDIKRGTPRGARAELLTGGQIRGTKFLTYEERANPWTQLQELVLTAFPHLDVGARRPTLVLDARYLVDIGMPLFRVTQQQDQPSALADLTSFVAYFLRLLLWIHIWTFRRPDPAAPREPQRLPGIVPGLPPPEIIELTTDYLANGLPVRVRLTRYRGTTTRCRAVVLIHGYSASGNTFAHHAVNPNLAQYLWNHGRDVWILDLRTSSGMPTARLPWAFEDAALMDIPAALARIHDECAGHADGKLDVVAHCMGSAMFSMAALAPPESGDRFFREREELPQWIGNVVLSQVGPVVRFSPANVFRAYAMRYFRQFVSAAPYEFRVGPDPSLADQLLDRFLASTPYPKDEFDIENPRWPWARTPFVGTRHRMDALYGRDFNIRNIDARVLAYIDDLFGPLNLETVSQTIHFAKLGLITNRSGRNVYLSRANLRERWRFRTLSIHGRENGLTDISTLARMTKVLETDAGRDFRTYPFDGLGHQDSLIGRTAGEVFKVMHDFLDSPDAPSMKAGDPRLVAEVPWLGPRVGPLDPSERCAIGAATDPGSNRALLLLLIPWDHNTGMDGVRTDPLRSALCIPAATDKDGWMSSVLESTDFPTWPSTVLPLFIYDQAAETSSDVEALERALQGPALRHVKFSWSRVQDWSPTAPARDPVTHTTTAAHAELPVTQVIITLLQSLKDAIRKVVGDAVNALDPATAEGAIAQLPPHRNTTAPRRDAVRFAVASCQYPAGILDGIPADRSLRALNDCIGGANGAAKPEFALLLGDQIYVDATAGLFDPRGKDDRLLHPYEQLLRRAGMQSALRQIPFYMMLDDHEISDNWEPTIDDRRTDKGMQEARTAYWKYQRAGSPLVADAEDPEKCSLAYQFEEGGVPFFVTDTRTERTARTAETVAHARIMSAGQERALHDWLIDHRNCGLPLFVASPSILLPRHLLVASGHEAASSLHSDSWDGYPRSMAALLTTILVHDIRNVVFLSGDEHLSCVAHAELSDRQGHNVRLHSIHSSPLYAPYPFANAVPEDFSVEETFAFTDKGIGAVGSYECRLTGAEFVPGDGFAILAVEKRGGRWTLSCEFVRENPSAPIVFAL